MSLANLFSGCFCWLVCCDLPAFPGLFGPCTNGVFTAYAHVRTEPQCDIGHTRGKKNGCFCWGSCPFRCLLRCPWDGETQIWPGDLRLAFWLWCFVSWSLCFANSHATTCVHVEVFLITAYSHKDRKDQLQGTPNAILTFTVESLKGLLSGGVIRVKKRQRFSKQGRRF